jgi:polysaccharide pyruvyl transferase WcaK-like protein
MAHYPDAFRFEGIQSFPDVFDYPFMRPRWKQALWLMKTIFWFSCVYVQAVLFRSRFFLFFQGKVRHFQWADLAVSVGAERINDKFATMLFWSVLSLRLLKAMGKKTVLFPCTIGPFLHRSTLRLSSQVLRRVDRIYTRDHESTRTCLETLRLPPTRITETVDVAVFQAWDQEEKSRALIRSFQRSEAFSTKIPLIGITPLKWTYRANKAETPYSNYDSYLREMVKLADTLVGDYGIKIGFYPTNFPEKGCREDDVLVCREVHNRMADPSSAFVADRLTSPSHFKGMLALSQVNIVTRMHACILSTGSGTPTLSINYLFKLKEYMESLGLGEFAVDIEDFNALGVLQSFSKMWNDRENWKLKIKEAIRQKQDNLLLALKQLDLLDH